MVHGSGARWSDMGVGYASVVWEGVRSRVPGLVTGDNNMAEVTVLLPGGDSRCCAGHTIGDVKRDLLVLKLHTESAIGVVWVVAQGYPEGSDLIGTNKRVF